MSARSPVTTCSQCLRALRKRSHQATAPRQTLRAFSESLAYSRGSNIPSFDASSPELTSLLGTIRTRIFLPSRLKNEQKKIVFRTSNRAILLNDPFYVDIGDEQFQLLPLDQTKDIPDSWKSLSQALKLMATDSQEWNNFIGLMEGFKQAKRRFKPWQYAMVVRMASEADKAHLVLECARSAARTGLVLRDLEVAREVMWAMRAKAVNNEWEKSAVERALRYAEQIASLLDNETHCGGKKKALPRDVDPRYQPDIIAVLLELAAVHAKLGGDAEKVRIYAQRLVPNLEALDKTTAVGENANIARNADEWLMRLVPVLRALQLASEVLGDGMPGRKQAATVASRLKAHLAVAASTVRESLSGADEAAKAKRRGLAWYEAVDQ